MQIMSYLRTLEAGLLFKRLKEVLQAVWKTSPHEVEKRRER